MSQTKRCDTVFLSAPGERMFPRVKVPKSPGSGKVQQKVRVSIVRRNLKKPDLGVERELFNVREWSGNVHLQFRLGIRQVSPILSERALKARYADQQGKRAAALNENFCGA